MTISIHVLREEDDRIPFITSIISRLFQSTSSARRTTDDDALSERVFLISIHVLREEDDLSTS